MALSKGPGDDTADHWTPEALQLAAYLSPESFHLHDEPSIEEYYSVHYIPEYYSLYLASNPSSDDADLKPGLRDHLAKLYDRQRQEDLDLRQDARNRLSPGGEAPEVLETFNEEFRQQYSRFAEERNRHIRDYQKAQALREEMQGRLFARRDPRRTPGRQPKTFILNA